MVYAGKGGNFPVLMFGDFWLYIGNVFGVVYAGFCTASEATLAFVKLCGIQPLVPMGGYFVVDLFVRFLTTPNSKVTSGG